MTDDPLNAACAGFPGAQLSQPFGPQPDVWKVGGKIFAVVHRGEGSVTVKTPDVETAQMLIEAGAAWRAPYFHKSWVLLPSAEDDPELLAHRLAVSYDTIFATLPRKTRAGIAPGD